MGLHHMRPLFACMPTSATLIACACVPAPAPAPVPVQEVDVGKHNWGNYFLAAYKGVFEHLEARGGAAPAPLGLQVMIHGTVPTGTCCAVMCMLCCARCVLRHAVLQLCGVQEVP